MFSVSRISSSVHGGLGYYCISALALNSALSEMGDVISRDSLCVWDKSVIDNAPDADDPATDTIDVASAVITQKLRTAIIRIFVLNCWKNWCVAWS